MQAVVWHGRGDVRVDAIAEPVLPAWSATLISVSRCGLCGSDRREFASGPFMIPRTPHPLTAHMGPVVLGHEIVGSVVEIGSGSNGGKTLAPGLRVAVDPTLRCGVCAACARGDTHLCEVAGCIGMSSDGGLAPLVVVPTTGLVPIPDNVTDDDAAVAEPLSVALHAIHRGRLTAGESVVVSGFGPIGAGVVVLARSAGATGIVVVEPSPARRELAMRLGATAVVDPGAAGDPSADLLDLRGFADIGFDCSGAPGSLEAVIRSTRAGARVVVPAVSSGTSAIPMSQVVLKERAIIGTLGNRGDISRVIDLLAQGRIALDGFVSSIVSLTEAARWIKGSSADRNELKILADPRL